MLFSEAWLKRFKERLNADPEMQVIGVLVHDRVLAGVRRQTVYRAFRAGPARRGHCFNATRCSMRLWFRASPEIWARFFQEDPNPSITTFSHAVRVPGFVLRSDTLVAMAKRAGPASTMNIMRTVE